MKAKSERARAGDPGKDKQLNGSRSNTFSSFILHPSFFLSSFILRPSSFSRWRSTILGTLLLLTGLGAALLTVVARNVNDTNLATAGALLSLLIAALMLVFLVPPLFRSSRLEVTRLDLPLEVTIGGGIFLAIVIVVGFA